MMIDLVIFMMLILTGHYFIALSIALLIAIVG